MRLKEKRSRHQNHCSSSFITGVSSLLFAFIACTGVEIHLRASEPNDMNRDPQQQMQIPEGLDFSRFEHSSQYHARLPCLLCHKRESNTARPTLPGDNNHLPCAGCHKQQFANNDGPICTICHTDVRTGAVKNFPRMKTFRMRFDHSMHVRMGGAGCTSCHRPSRGGVALSIPSGFNAHDTCFRCHQPRTQSEGRDISSCGVCHQLGSYSRTPEFVAAYRVNFSHSEHQTLTCNQCHKVRAGMPQRRQVTSPQPLNHHASSRGLSCMSCHDGKRAFGGEDFSACKRCHTGDRWRF
jgi:c(7)-type cytochrome triheme protein